MKYSKSWLSLVTAALPLFVACGANPDATDTGDRGFQKSSGIGLVWNYNASTQKCYLLHLLQNRGIESEQPVSGEAGSWEIDYIVWVGNAVEHSQESVSAIRTSEAMSRCGSIIGGDLASYKGVFKTITPWNTVFQPLFREQAESDACMSYNGVGATEFDKARSTKELKVNRTCQASYMFISGSQDDHVDMSDGQRHFFSVEREMVYDAKSTAMAADMEAIRALIVQAIREGKPSDAKSKAYRENHDLSATIFDE